MARRDLTEQPWTTTWRATVLLLLVLGAAVVALVIRAPWREPGPVANDGDRLSGELAHLEILGRALRLHAEEHDGRYPATIADIEWRLAQPGMDASGLPAVVSRFHHPDSRKVLDWLYFAGHTTSDPAVTILAASPVAVGPHGDRRLVTRINNVTESLPESEFQKQLESGKSD